MKLGTNQITDIESKLEKLIRQKRKNTIAIMNLYLSDLMEFFSKKTHFY